MNLVAKEYVAAQSPKDPGVLVLSRFAGAAPELEDGALIVNPYDEEGVGEALQRALSMDPQERRVRWRAMYDRIRQHDGIGKASCRERVCQDGEVTGGAGSVKKTHKQDTIQ